MSYTAMILAAAKVAKIPGALLLAICMHETGLNNTLLKHDGNSPTYGVCQIKYETAKDLGYSGSAMGLMNPKINTLWAAKYVRHQMDRYGDDWCKVAAAYNAGSYNESKVAPGYPRNLKYVRHVQRKLASVLQPRLSCRWELADERM